MPYSAAGMCCATNPSCCTPRQARELADLAGRRRLLNAVAYNRRFDRGCLYAHEALKTGAIGPVRYVEAVQLGYERGGWFLDPALGGGGPFTGRGSHMADLVPWLLGRRPTRLRARLRGDGGPRCDSGGFIELQFNDLECHLTCIAEGWHMWDELRLFGEQGLIELRRPLPYPLGWEVWHWSERGEVLYRRQADPAPGGATRDMLAALRGGPPPACPFAAAVDSVALIEHAFTSARSGGAWLTL